MLEAKDSFRGMYFIFNNTVCQVLKKEAVNVGTHSHTKTKLYIKPVEGGGEKEVVFNHTDKIEELDIRRKSGQVISGMAGRFQVMDSHSYETFEAEQGKEFTEDVAVGDDIVFIQYAGKTMIIDRVRS